MLFALVMLGRRHQRATTLLLLAVLGPGVALFALGLVKRDLFDIRYLSTIVPVLFVLLARADSPPSPAARWPWPAPPPSCWCPSPRA